jgi:hypothetical protein
VLLFFPWQWAMDAEESSLGFRISQNMLERVKYAIMFAKQALTKWQVSEIWSDSVSIELFLKYMLFSKRFYSAVQ